MDDIQEIKTDVKEIKSTLMQVELSVAKNTTSLDIHMKRTALNEQRIEKLEYWLLGALIAIVISLIKLNI